MRALYIVPVLMRLETDQRLAETPFFAADLLSLCTQRTARKFIDWPEKLTWDPALDHKVRVQSAETIGGAC